MMLGTADPQGSLLGVDSLLSKLFEGDESSFYARLARHGDELIRDKDFAACYSSGQGRPSIPPSLLMKAVSIIWSGQAVWKSVWRLIATRRACNSGGATT